MKVFNLHCEQDHRFEGWFASEEDFHSQTAKSLIECPVCASHAVTRLPAAPRLNLSTASKDTAVAQQEIMQRLQAQWIALSRQIIASTEDVGERFAEEARRIHYQEAPERAIRGTATREERQELADEGIETIAFPLPAALKHPIQ